METDLKKYFNFLFFVLMADSRQEIEMQGTSWFSGRSFNHGAPGRSVDNCVT